MNIVINRMKELEEENSELKAINSKLWRENEIIESMLKVSACEMNETEEKKKELEKEIEQLKRIAEEKCNEIDRLKKENEALTHNYKTLEKVTSASISEKSRENEQLKATIKRLEYGSETSHRMLNEAFDDYNYLKGKLKKMEELVQYYINQAAQAREELEKKESELSEAKTVLERFKTYHRMQAEADITNTLSRMCTMNVLKKEPGIPVGIDPLLVNVYVNKTI